VLLCPKVLVFGHIEQAGAEIFRIASQNEGGGGLSAGESILFWLSMLFSCFYDVVLITMFVIKIIKKFTTILASNMSPMLY